MSELDQDILIYAVRYCLRRQSHTVDDACMAVREKWPHLEDANRRTIITDIDRAMALGIEDASKWRALRAWCEARL